MKDRPSLGESLARRLTSRSSRRPRMALDPAFYARFGLADPWSGPELEGEAESGDGMVFLSGAPFYAMMRRLANARRRRERRQERFFRRRAGTTMRAATRRWAGEAEGVVPTFRSLAITGDAFVLPAAPAPIAELAPTESAPAVRGAYQAMRPVASPWYTTPFVPARVVGGGPTAGGRTAADRQPAERVVGPRPLARVGERLAAASVEQSGAVQTAGGLPARVRRAIATVFSEEFAPETPIVEVVRILRRAGAPAAIIREVVEVAPQASASSVAARRMPVSTATRATGLRPALARSPAMALAASAATDQAAAGTLAEAERSSARSGVERPRRIERRPGARAASRAAGPVSTAPLSATPVARVSAGRPAALRAVATDGGAGGVAAEASSASPASARSTPSGARRAFWRPLAVDGVEAAEASVAAPASAPVRASAHAGSRAVTAPPAPRRMARSDGLAWAWVRSTEPEVAETSSALPSAVPALRRAAPARASSARPTLATPTRFVTARLAAATPAPRAPGAPVAAARSARARPSTLAALRPDRELLALQAPPAGASPVQQAVARLAAPAAVVGTSAVPHPTPRLDRPTRRARVLGAESLTVPVVAEPTETPTPAAGTAPARRRPATPIAAPVAAERARRVDVARAVRRAAARAESPSRVAVSRVEGSRVAMTAIAQSAAPPVPAEGREASGPLAWAPTARHGRSPVVSRPLARGGRVSAPPTFLDVAELPPGAPVREPTGRFVSARVAATGSPLPRSTTRTARGEPRAEVRAVPRFVAGPAGRVEVIYVSPASFQPEAVEPAVTPARSAPARAMAWAAARTLVSAATAYRGAIGDGGLPAVETARIEGFDPGVRRPRSPLAAPGTTLRTEAAEPVTSAPATAPSRAARRAAAQPERPSRAAARATAAAAPPARRPTLGNDAFVAPATFGFDGPDLAQPGAPAPVETATPTRPESRRLPLDRRLHGMATGGAPASASTPTWTARSDGAPMVRSVHGLFESLARATTAEQVVHVLFSRADGLMSAPAAIAAPIQQVISEIRQEVSRAPQAAASEDASLPTRPSRLAAPEAEPLRPNAGGSRPVSSTRVARGTVRPVASRARTIGSGSEDRIMSLVRKLQGLIHLAEQENRLAEAQRQVRMAEESQEARGEGGQGARGGGQAGSAQDGSKMDIEQLGREVLDVVSRELEYRRERRMEDHDESIWW